MRKLGIKKISRQTVRNILKEEGVKPGPKRRTDTWAEFIKRHGETLWACDFFSVRTITNRGLRQMYVLVFICSKTREIIVSESTEHPNSAWVCKQASMFLDQTANRECKPAILLHDRDKKFSAEFKQTLKDGGVNPIPLPKASPNLNGRCERVIQTIKYEALARFIIFGRRHLDYLVAEFVDYYNHRRSRMERDWLPPIREEPDEVETIKMDQIEVKSYVGGLIKSFERKAA